ncbi:hypothetical protein E4U16_004702 [Claviceps sp. LM84 group G4]|nr:hypothetical protein E4U33_005537 [Claviceps sp. LM78 group G4]KAG6073434.1 hypothetical protein E4U16_004702 [Claviceps sp. LM84 group G4]
MATKNAVDDMKKKLRLLKLHSKDLDDREIVNAPIFTEAVRHHLDGREVSDALLFSQYGLLGGEVAKLRELSSRTSNRETVSSGNIFTPVSSTTMSSRCSSTGSSSGNGNGSSSSSGSSSSNLTHEEMKPEDAPFVHYNVAAPSSTFICGSQGSGKSHTLSCMLENCLLESDANTLPKPLTGIVFHYDAFSSDANGQPCEAAHLSSNPHVRVRVLCSPTNVGQMKITYGRFKNVEVQELRLSQRNLNTRRMLDLMAVSSTQGGALPLYFHIIMRILKDMRIEQQKSPGSYFNYRTFRDALKETSLSKDQTGPLNQRLETLESFMAQEDVGRVKYSATRGASRAQVDTATRWEGKPGQLTIVDLSCPCITAESACALFNICLSLFLEQNTKTGRVIALDEAHKYMTDSAESQTLTESLLATIRLQRHLGARVIIATQEPTISPKLLDLCSITIVHRFTSPDWLQSLKKHLAAAQPNLIQSSSTEIAESGDHVAILNRPDALTALFARIVALRQGEALLFCPSALIGAQKSESVIPEDGAAKDGFADWAKAQNGTAGSQEDQQDHNVLVDASGNRLVRLGCGVMHIRVRERVTDDGGQSIMAR